MRTAKKKSMKCPKMIDCKLREFSEFGSAIAPTNKKIKNGFYSNSVYPIKGYGRDRWVIITHVDVDCEKYLAEGMSEKQIFQGCIDHLNQPPSRKKYAKKKPQPLYGELKLYKAKIKEGESGKFVEAEIITNQRKNKHFWREGMKITKKRKK